MALAQIGAGAASAGNGYAQYNANLGQSRYQSSIFNQNAQIADMQSAQVTRRAEFEANMRGLQGAQEIGKVRAEGSGAVDVNTGSMANVQTDIAAASAADEANIKQNAALQRWGYGVEAANYRGQAQLTKIGGRFAANSSLISGGGAFARDMMGANVSAYKAGWYGQQGPQSSDSFQQWQQSGRIPTKQEFTGKEWD